MLLVSVPAVGRKHLRCHESFSRVALDLRRHNPLVDVDRTERLEMLFDFRQRDNGSRSA